MRKYLLILAIIPVVSACETMSVITGAGEVVYEVFCDDADSEKIEKLDKRVTALEKALYNNYAEKQEEKSMK